MLNDFEIFVWGGSRGLLIGHLYKVLLANMAEVVDTTVGGTQQPGNCESLQEHGPEDKRFGGAASTTTTQLAETSDCRKRPGGSSPSKARIYFPLYI